MVIKTFNLDEETYELYAEFCKKQGISMSKRVERFIKEDLLKLHEEHGARVNPKAPKPQNPIFDKDHSMRKYC